MAAVGGMIAADSAETIEASDCILLPGFVDTHRHTWQSLLRSTAVDWTLGQYFAGVRGVMGRAFTADDMYVGNYVGALEALDAGITTIYDYSHNNNSPDHADAAVRGLKDSGIRAVFGYGNSNDEWVPVSDKPTQFDDLVQVCATHFASDDQLVTMAFAPRGPQYATMARTIEDFHRARELALPVTVHVGDGLWGMNGLLLQLKQHDLLLPGTLYVHGNQLRDEEFRLMAESGGTASITPEVELNMGHGFLATFKLLSAGISPSIGIDVVTSIGGDMFGAMKILLTGSRAVINDQALKEKRLVDPLPLMASDVLRFATFEGAKAGKLEKKVGVIRPGFEADLVLIRCNTLNLIPMSNPIGAVVECAHVGNIDSVFVQGRAMKRHGKLIHVDVASLARRVNAQRDALYARVRRADRWVLAADAAPRGFCLIVGIARSGARKGRRPVGPAPLQCDRVGGVSSATLVPLPSARPAPPGEPRHGRDRRLGFPAG